MFQALTSRCLLPGPLQDTIPAIWSYQLVAVSYTAIRLKSTTVKKVRPKERCTSHQLFMYIILVWCELLSQCASGEILLDGHNDKTCHCIRLAWREIFRCGINVITIIILLIVLFTFFWRDWQKRGYFF